MTRFVVFRSLGEDRLGSIGDIGEFLTDSIVKIAAPGRFSQVKEEEEKAFRDTFSALSSSLGDESFRKYDTTKNKHLGGFLISAFEPIALGIGFNYTNCAEYLPVDKIQNAIRDLWANEVFLKHSGTGVRASTRVPSNIPLGRQLFAP